MGYVLMDCASVCNTSGNKSLRQVFDIATDDNPRLLTNSDRMWFYTNSAYSSYPWDRPSSYVMRGDRLSADVAVGWGLGKVVVKANAHQPVCSSDEFGKID